MKLNKKDIIRFWAKVKITKNNCWEWCASKTNVGYGQFRVGHTMVNAHRVSFAIKNHSNVKNKVICHKCDNKVCVNPHHLFGGTHYDNMLDKVSKGRHTFGETVGNSKLKTEDIKFIFSQYNASKMNIIQISKKLNVSFSLVAMILRGEIWGHLGLKRKYGLLEKQAILRNKLAREYYYSEKSYKNIADEYGVCKQTVIKAVKEFKNCLNKSPYSA